MAKYLFYSLLVVFSFLLLQTNYKFIKSGSLKGAFVPAKNVDFSFKDWFSGTFQQKRDAYLNENFGFRNDAVRLNNQLDYSLYRQSNVSKIIVGKDDYLYENLYLDSYLGISFTSNERLENKIKTIRTLQDTLAKQNKYLLTIIAPGKGYFYPEMIPDNYGKQQEHTNYDVFLEFSKQNNINLIDFNAWFMGMKDTSRYCLYPQRGTHWSNYGTVLAADSLLRYIEGVKEVDLPEISWDKIEVSENCRGIDCDIEETLNLIFKYSNQALAYPKVKINKKGKDKIKTLIVGDSFYWNLFGIDLHYSAFAKNSTFFFYNKTVHPKRDVIKPAKELDILAEIDQVDLVILMSSDPSLPWLGWGFAEKANELFLR